MTPAVHSRSNARPRAWSTALVFLIAVSAWAQFTITTEESKDTIYQRYKRAVGLMTEGSFEKALPARQEITRTYGKDAEI